MLTLSNIKGSDKSHRDRKRIGRGQGSGQGTQAGKGHKGQKARSGGGAPIGFEGGQTPLYRRLPKRGFSNAPFKKHYASISLKLINLKFADGVVNKDKLLELGLLSGQKKNLPIKILNCDQFDKKLTFQGIEFFSKSAKEKILALGGSIEA